MTDKEDSTVAVSVIVTLHKEGILAYKTLRNIEVMIRNAKKKLITCEILLGLDNADELTARIAREFKERVFGATCTLYISTFGDLGLNRNNLVEKCKGKYILIHDGDDFFTQNFIVEAYAAAQRSMQLRVYIPQFLVNFDANHYMVPYIPSSSSLISKRFFFETNYYTSQYFIPHVLLDEVKYQPSDEGYGYEDWWLTSELIARGIEFTTVKNTVFYYRRKKNGSLLSRLNAEATMIRKTKLFEPEIFLSLKPAQKKKLLISDRQKTSRLSILCRPQNFTLFILAYKYFLRLEQLHRVVLRVINDRYICTKKHARNNWTAEDDPARTIIERNKLEVPPRVKDIGVSQRLIREWGKLNSIEPLIRASWDIFEYIPITYYPTDSGFSNAYYDFCKKFANKRIDDIIFVPHMVRGGAELATIHLTKALTDKGKKVLVVSSLNSNSVWGRRINEIKGACFIENKSLLIHVPDDAMRMLFWARVVQYWNVKRVTTINSEFGYSFIKSYSRQLRDMECRSYVHTYAFDVTEDGYLFNYIPNGLVELYGSVGKYITDSKFYRKQLIDINGFDRETVKTLYLPIDNSKLNPKRNFVRKNKVIYAARICNQKIADVAVEVGRRLGDYGIELHFYGNIDPEYAIGNKFLNMIEKVPSVKYMGSFDAFGKLPLNAYDMYLLTTRTEGLANVILEACLSNIFIISVAVGGLPECVVNGQNGYLIPDTVEKFNAQSYVDAIMKAYETEACFDWQKMLDVNQKVAIAHSWEKYEQTVKEIMMVE